MKRSDMKNLNYKFKARFSVDIMADHSQIVTVQVFFVWK